MSAEKPGLQRFAGPFSMSFLTGVVEHGFIQQGTLGIADMLDVALAHARFLERLANSLDLLRAVITQLSTVLCRCPLSQRHHQQITVLHESVDKG